MRRKKLTPLNPAFAGMRLYQLIANLEQACVFDAPELEAELNARLERIGKQWRFIRSGKIELYFPSKTGVSKSLVTSACLIAMDEAKSIWRTCYERKPLIASLASSLHLRPHSAGRGPKVKGRSRPNARQSCLQLR